MKKWVVGKLHGTLPTTTMAQLCSFPRYHVDSLSISVSHLIITINRGFSSCSIGRKMFSYAALPTLGRWCGRAACFDLFWFVDKFLRSWCKRHQKNIPHMRPTSLLCLALRNLLLSSISPIGGLLGAGFIFVGFTPSHQCPQMAENRKILKWLRPAPAEASVLLSAFLP